MQKIACTIFMTTLLSAALAGQDTAVTADTPRPAHDTAAMSSVIDTTTIPDSLLPPIDTSQTAAVPKTTIPQTSKTAAMAAAQTDSADTVTDSFPVFSSTIGAIGIGLSLGSLPVLKTWKNGLPFTINDFRLPAVVDTAGDTAAVRFTVKQSPDIYNMMFPVTLSLSRLGANHRFGLSLSGAMLSKKFNAALEIDSLRSVSLEQSMRYYTVLAEFVYGARIPELYFSVDNIDRTDAIVGIAVAPYIGLHKSLQVTPSRSGDDALEAIRDSLIANENTFNAAGIAVAWRLGMVTLRKISKTGGIETTLSYQGLWCTRFKTSHETLDYGTIDPDASEPDAEVTYFSNRFDITISLIRRLF
jgi:hypothetical protein